MWYVEPHTAQCTESVLFGGSVSISRVIDRTKQQQKKIRRRKPPGGEGGGGEGVCVWEEGKKIK